MTAYPPTFGELRRGVVGVALPLGSVEAIERLARDLIAFGYGIGESKPQSAQQLEWHTKAEAARSALMENVSALRSTALTRDEADRIEAIADEWDAVDATLYWRHEVAFLRSIAGRRAPPGEVGK